MTDAQLLSIGKFLDALYIQHIFNNKPILLSGTVLVQALLDIFGISIGLLLLPSPPSLRALICTSRSSPDGTWSSTDVLFVSTTLLPLCQFWRYTTCTSQRCVSGSMVCRKYVIYWFNTFQLIGFWSITRIFCDVHPQAGSVKLYLIN